MTVTIQTTGTGEFRGHSTNVVSYEYTEGAMPGTVFDDSGEIGQLSFNVEDTDSDKAILLYRDSVELNDNFYGYITGTVNGFQYSDGSVNATGNSRLNLINTEGYIAPAVTTVREYVLSILAAAGINFDVTVSPLVPNTTITTPAQEGNLWVILKRFASLHELDVSLIRNTIYIRPMRELKVEPLNVVNNIVALSEESFSRKFQVAYYNYERLVDTLAYPFGGWNREVEVYQVEAGETVTFDIEVNGFLESVKQPIVQDVVAKDYSGADSVFSASGNDGLPVTAAFWDDYDGDMSFEILENGTILRVTIVGPDFEEYSPYTIGVSDGATEYSTLRIIGTGVFSDRQLVTLPTGLTEVDTPQEFGKEIDNVFISTREEAYQAGVRARRRYSLPKQVYQSSSRRFEKPRFDSNQIVFFLNFQFYNDSLPEGYLFSDFNTDYSASTFQDFNESVAEIITQSFGTVAGSRVRFKDAFYRIVSSSVSQNEVAIDSEYDTLFSDVSTEFTGNGFSEFNSIWFGLSFDDYALIPLRDTTDIDYFTLDEDVLDGEAVLAF